MQNALHIKLKQGEVIRGSHVFAGMPILTEAMAQAGFDVLWLDMEHTAIGIETLVNNMIAAKAGGTPAWVRIPWNDPVRAKPILEMGPGGLIFPMIRSYEEALKAVQSGQTVFGTEIVSRLPGLLQEKKDFDWAAYDINEKELNVTALVAEGLSNREIAETLFLSEGTVRNYISNVLCKLELRDRTQLAVYYLNVVR